MAELGKYISDRSTTIHKIDVCSRQKSPKPMDTSSDSVLHAGYNYGLLFEIEPTFLVLVQDFKIFTRDFYS